MGARVKQSDCLLTYDHYAVLRSVLLQNESARIMMQRAGFGSRSPQSGLEADGPGDAMG